MDPRQSFSLILLLLAALVFGPVMVLTGNNGRERPLRPLAANERLLDAPNSAPKGPAPFPEAKTPGKGPFFR